MTSSKKFGTAEIKENYLDGSFYMAKYEGELNDDNKPHGKGTLTDANMRFYNIEFEDGTPVIGCKFTCVDEKVMKFEGKLIDIGVDSMGYQIDCWTMKGRAFFPKISGSFFGTIQTDYTFIDGIFKTALLTVNIRTRKGSLVNRRYKQLNRCLIVADLYEKRTYYKVDEKMFHNRNGVTYTFPIDKSNFILALHKSGTVNQLTEIDLPIKDIYDCHIEKYVPDEKLATMAGF